MGKSLKQQFCPCWKKAPTDSDEEDATNDKSGAPGSNEESGAAKAKTEPQELSDDDMLLKRISDTELKLTRAIEDMYHKLSDQEKANMDAMKRFLAMCVENRLMEANTPTGPPSVLDGEGMVSVGIEPIRPIIDGGHMACFSSAQESCRRRSSVVQKDVGTYIDCRYDVQGRVAARDSNSTVSGESQDDPCSQKSASRGSIWSMDGSCSRKSPSRGSVTSNGGPCSSESPSREESVPSLFTGPDTSFEDDNKQKELVNGSLQANAGTSNFFANETDTPGIDDGRAGHCNPCVAFKSFSVEDVIHGQGQQAYVTFARRSLSDFDTHVDKTLGDFFKRCNKTGGVRKGFKSTRSPLDHPTSPNADRNTNPHKCIHVPVEEPIQMCEGETPVNGFPQNHGCKPELSKQEPASTNAISITSTDQSSKRKLSKLGMSSTDLWSNQADLETRSPKPVKRSTNEHEEATIEVECFGLAVPDSRKLYHVPVDIPSEETDNSEIENVDFDVPENHEQELGNMGDVHDKVTAHADTDGDEDSVHKVQQLKMFCLKLFFQEEPFDKTNRDFGRRSQIYSKLALMYINDAYQNARNKGHDRIEGNTTVQTLKYLCRQIFGIQGLATVKESNKDLNSDVKLDTGQGKLADLQCDARSQNTDQSDAGYSDTNVESAKKEMAGQFRAKVLRAKVKAPSEEKWEEWTEPTTADLLQLKNKIPEFGRTPRTPLNTHVTISLREIMDRYMSSGLITEFHGQFLCINVLRALKFLHLNRIVHSAVIPAKVVFNTYGYPILIPNIVTPEPEPRIEYASPEQITGDPITMATDIFQTGLLVYSFMYGKSPYQGNNPSETKANLLNDAFCPEFADNTISKDGRYFIRKCLRKDPEVRFKLVKCRKSLDKAVKWFSIFDDDELANLTSPSPFTDFVLANQNFSQTKGSLPHITWKD